MIPPQFMWWNFYTVIYNKLTSFDDGNRPTKPISYDAIGNPLTYNGYTYTWEEGRQLATLSGNGYTIAYKYNDLGIGKWKSKLVPTIKSKTL